MTGQMCIASLSRWSKSAFLKNLVLVAQPLLILLHVLVHNTAVWCICVVFKTLPSAAGWLTVGDDKLFVSGSAGHWHLNQDVGQFGKLGSPPETLLLA